MTKRTLLPLAFLVAAAVATPAYAQLDLPRPSPNAKVVQTVGLTDVTVDYSCPGVKSRAIWGGLVPYDKVWRTGANGLTKITFSKDVLVADKAVPAGTYALFTIPGKSAFTVILSKNLTQNATGNEYSEKDDELRFSATPQTIAPRERLQFVFADMTDEAASLDMEWEKVKLSIPIKVKTGEQAAANIKTATENAWRLFANAARYELDSKKDADAALKLVDESIAMKEDWFNLWIKAQALSAKGKHKDAYAAVTKAEMLGSKGPAPAFFYADEVKKALATWPKK